MNEFKGLIIDSIDYKEKSKIVYLYTPYGKESILVKAGKAYKAGNLGMITTLNEVSFVKSKAKLPTMIEYHILNSYFEITSSIEKIKAISIILEIIKNIPIDTNHERCYNFIISTLNDLKNNSNTDKILSIFLIKMLYPFGVNPSLKECVNCYNKSNLVFLDIARGGALCSNCTVNNTKEKLDIWKEYYYEKKKIEEYSDVDFKKLLKDISLYYNIHLSIDLKIGA